MPGYYYSLPFLDPDEIRLEVNHVPGKGVFADGRAPRDVLARPRSQGLAASPSVELE